MKNYYGWITFQLLCILFSTNCLFGQAAPGCDPANVTPLGSTVNVWDWTIPIYEAYYYDAVGNPSPNIQIESPFYDPSPNGSPNTAHLSTHGVDFDPEDGWEILYENMGGPIDINGTIFTEYVQIPSFALYNRYSGQIRALAFVPTNNSAPFDIIRNDVGHQTEFPSMYPDGSAIFSFMQTPHKALDSFEPFGNIASSYNYYVGAGVWVILDFVTAYDPCVCETPSSINFGQMYRDTAQIILNFEGTGETKPIIENGVPNSPVQSGFDVATNALGAFGSGLMSFNTLENYYSTVNAFTVSPSPVPPLYFQIQKPAHTLTVLGNLLPGWIGAGNSVVKILRFLVGKKGKATPAKITGYSTKFKFEGTGGITNTQLGNPATIWTPGSGPHNEDPLQDGDRPIYNNPLGVFNLVETPRISMKINDNPQELDRGYDFYYSLEENIKYVVNTTAGFEPEPSRIMLALAFEDCKGNLNAMRLLTQEQGGIIRTPLVDAACFLDQHANFFAGFTGTTFPSWEENECYGRVTLQVFATLVPIDGSEEVVFMGAFDVEEDDSPTNIPGPPQQLGFNTDSQAANGCNENTLSTISLSELEEFCRNTYDPSPREGRMVAVLSDQELISKDSRILVKSDQETENQELSAYPNPFDKRFVLTLPAGRIPRFIEIIDQNGQVVKSWHFPKSTSSQTTSHVFDASSLPSGVYIGKITFEDGISNIKIIKA